MNIGERRFTLVGGVAIDRAFLGRFARDSDVSVSLVTPEGSLSSDSVPHADGRSVSAEQPLAYIDARGGAAGDSMHVAPARLVVAHSSAELDALRRDVSRWFALAVAAAAVAGLALAAWMSAALSGPIAALARATQTIALGGSRGGACERPRRRDRRARSPLRRDGATTSRERGRSCATRSVGRQSARWRGR